MLITFKIFTVSLNFCLSVYAVSDEEQIAFMNWRDEFRVDYSDVESESSAFKIFCFNRKRIEKHNEQYFACNSSYALGLWKKSDISDKVVNLTLNGFEANLEFIGRAFFIGGNQIMEANVSYLNYVDKGFVTPVQDQGNCGSCWAFATTGSLEAQVFKKFKSLSKLSEQQLIDCSLPYGNLGCRAGVIGFAYRYVIDNGISLNSHYPYRGTAGRACAYNQNFRNISMSAYSWVPVRDENTLKNVLFSIGPLAIGVDASLFTFQNYKTGVYDDVNCGETMDKLNHAVLVVGYGTDDQWGDYWIIKNSYGKSWGEYGYMRMKRGENRCGLLNYVVFPRL